MRKLVALGVFAAVAIAGAGAAFAALDAMPWNVDAAHTQVNFKVRHFFTPVTGAFSDYEVELVFDKEDPKNSRVNARIAVTSVNTGNERRDAHLRTADFFEVDAHPYITFASTSVEDRGDGELVAHGDLTIKGVTQRVAVPVKLLGVQPIPEAMRGMLGGITESAGFQANLKIDRTAFGVGTGSWAETAIVGGEVEIEILVEANHK